jgi:hypothetical protein
MQNILDHYSIIVRFKHACNGGVPHQGSCRLAVRTVRMASARWPCSKDPKSGIVTDTNLIPNTGQF